MDTSRLHYIGIFRSPVSWAKVNREFVGALDQAGVDVSVTSLRGLHYEESFPLPDRLETLIDRPRDADVELAMEYPDNLWKLEGGVNLTWILYETDFPDDWVKAYREHADVFFCPSPFVRRKAMDAGLPEDRTFVVPFGVNMSHYNPDVTMDGPDRPGRELLTVGPPHKRKGFRELIDGYTRAFSSDDPVSLRIKTYDRASSDRLYPWEFDLDAYLEEETDNRSPTIHVDRSAYDETEMAQLFRAADVFVLPSYGEAFGLSVLESMAVGTPVVGVDYGPVPDLVNEQNGWLLEGEEVELSGVAYDQEGPCTFCVPSPDEIGDLLQHIINRPERIQARKTEAVQTARHWSWDRSAQRFAQALAEL